MSAVLHVAAAVITNPRGEVLIALRPEHLHQGGRWEFPGGKVEAGEAVEAALARELDEELGITPQKLRPLIRVRHDYPDRSVLLDVWRVGAFAGTAHGREGQTVNWVAPEALPAYRFPAANQPIVTAARLPSLYLITGEPAHDAPAFLHALETSLRAGVALVQLRAKALDAAAYRRLAEAALGLCRAYGARLLLNSAPALAAEIGADGVHLSSARLRALAKRPLDRAYWVAASCHDAGELAQACRLGVDFVVLSPVQATVSHPGAPALGWEGLRALTEQATLPAYALGGMGLDALPAAWGHGAQGIAAIGALWGVSDLGTE